jgi:cell filamentation protein
LLKTSPIKVNTSKDVLETHKFIFKDIYPFAGQMRTCPIWKRGQQFAMPNEIPERLKQIDKLIAQYNTIPTDQPILDLRNQVSDKLAGIINAINWMHGFREGNGRTQRAVGHSLALDKNFDLQLNRDKDSETYKRYMAGTSENDNEILSNIIFENLKPFSDL